MSPPNHFCSEMFRDQGFFSELSHSKNGQGITMAETLIIILAEHNVPMNFADHFTKLVSNKLVFPDSVFLRVRAAHAPCLLKVVIACVVTNFFPGNLTGLLAYTNTVWSHLGRLMTEPTKWHVYPGKTQTSLGIQPVWSESSLSAWRKLGPLAPNWADREDSDQTGWMPRLIWGFAQRTLMLLVLSYGSSIQGTGSTLLF